MLGCKSSAATGIADRGKQSAPSPNDSAEIVGGRRLFKVSFAKKRLNRSRCRLVFGFGWAEGTMCEMELQIASSEGTVFRGKDMPDAAESCAKRLNRSRYLLGLWTRVGLRKPAVYTGATWLIQLNRLCTAAIRPYVQLDGCIVWNAHNTVLGSKW